MVQQIPVSHDALIDDAGGGRTSSLRIARPDIAYLRLVMVNVAMVGDPFAGDRQWVLVDAGLPATAGMIRRAAAARFGAGSRPAAIVLTHGHFDHVGGIAKLSQAWEAPVYAHRLELPYLRGEARYPPPDPGVGGGLMTLMSPLYPRGPIRIGDRLQALPDDGGIPGMPGWRWIHTPGHSVGHVSLWREFDRTLLAGDAFVTTAQESLAAVIAQRPELHGPPKYYTTEWDKAARSVRQLAALEPEVVVAGHGRALRDAPMRASLVRLADEFSQKAIPAAGRYLRHPARAEDGSAYCAP